MARKYLEELNFDPYYDTVNDSRQSMWEEQQQEFGFDERETWAMDTTFLVWLYEHLRMYVDIGGEIVDLTFHTFEYQGKEYNQLELINKMLEDIRVYLKNEKDCTEVKDLEENYERKQGILNIWALVCNSMWW